MSNFLINWHIYRSEIRKKRENSQINPDDNSKQNLLKGYKDKDSKKNNGNNHDKNS